MEEMHPALLKLGGLLLVSAVTLSGVDAHAQVDYGMKGCDASVSPTKFFNPTAKDVVFVAFGDPQYGWENKDANIKQIKAIEAAKGLVWPELESPSGATISSVKLDNIRGVIIAGDLIHAKDPATEWESFATDYGLCANKKLGYPVYEGYGNHDLIDSPTTSGDWEPDATTVNQPAVADYVAVRNQKRPLIGKVASGKKGHYSWTWGDIHFIQLNLAPTAWARDALDFLDKELARLGKKPVVVITHYGFGTWHHEPTKAEQRAYDAVIRGHNVIAHIHGHHHGSTAPVRWKLLRPEPTSYAVPMFNVGSPLYEPGGDTGYHGTGDRYVHFSAFRITEKHIIACDVRAAQLTPDKPEFNKRNWCAVFDYNK